MLRFLRRSQAPGTHNLWELWCAGFSHSAGLHARVILDGARDVLSVLGVALVVPIVSRVLVTKKEE